jgi:hypothetical protein
MKIKPINFIDENCVAAFKTGGFDFTLVVSAEDVLYYGDVFFLLFGMLETKSLRGQY